LLAKGPRRSIAAAFAAKRKDVQEYAMQDANAAGWAGESQLSAGMLGSLHELNHRFLGLSAALVDRELSAEQRVALARCPYALFDLRFHDDAHWLSRLQEAAGWRVADQAAVDGECADFARLALFFAWHLASTTALAAQLVLGMNDGTAEALRRMTVDRLPALAAAEARHLSPRWAHCAAYWNTLMHAAARPDPLLLRRAQLFGLQLAAGARLPPAGQQRRSARNF
jgi:hypothetical protein